jgi:hypothetical protein
LYLVTASKIGAVKRDEDVCSLQKEKEEDKEESGRTEKVEECELLRVGSFFVLFFF